MKQPPKGAVFEKHQMLWCEYLRHVLDRLDDEVGTYFQLIGEHNRKSERKIGFWSSIRILMPIVEAISHVVGESPQELLGNHLDVKTPYLAWDLFRHSLIHGDYLQHAKYQNKDVGWGVAFIGVSHIIQNGHIGIDPIYLYKKLREYLEHELSKNDQTVIEFEVGVLYQNPKQEIIDDFDKL